jgi:K+-sensing histidine kinase KdpD
MRTAADHFLRPWSLAAFIAAFLMIAFAAAVDAIFGISDATLCFVAFLPAVLVLSLLEGAPAGIFAVALTVPLVWWAFMPPFFEFNPLTDDQYRSIGLFLRGSALVIAYSYLYREASRMLRE